MSVYIKGMEMPTRCSECRFLVGNEKDGMCLAAEVWMDDDFWMWFLYDEGDVDTRKPLNCPLVPVPPHNCVRFVHLNDDGEKTLWHGNWCYYINDSPYEDL